MGKEIKGEAYRSTGKQKEPQDVNSLSGPQTQLKDSLKRTILMASFRAGAQGSGLAAGRAANNGRGMEDRKGGCGPRFAVLFAGIAARLWRRVGIEGCWSWKSPAKGLAEQSLSS